MTDRYDTIVIGAGQGGGPLAGRLARSGRRVAIVEREHAGGTCVNEGCTPTKTMIASARVAHVVRRAAGYGVAIGAPADVTVDLARVRERKRAIVERFRSGSERSLTETDGLDYIEGGARFTGPKQVAVALNAGGELDLSAPTIVVNVGTRPAVPAIAGLEGVPYLTNASLMELDAVPEHLVVVGGGYVGVEFGQMFRRFGSRVTILQHGPQLLGQEDADIAEALADALREEGLEIWLGASTDRVEATPDGVRLTATVNGEERAVEGTHLLVATGRTPNTDGLGLEHAGVQLDARGYIPADDRLRTAADGIYALGDVTGGPAFTHISYDDYRIVASDLLGNGSHPGRARRVLAYTVYTDPQLGRVGMSEQQARSAGHDVRVATLPMAHVARAIETDETRGLMKAVVDARTDRILGAAVLGPEGGELAATLQIAMLGDLPFTALRDAPIAHPTFAESLNNLFARL